MSILGEKGLLWQGSLTFMYTIEDEAGNSSSGTVVVPPPNATPVVQDDIAATVSGGSATIDVLANDSDPEGGALTVTAASAVSGSVVINTDNTLTYTAAGGFVGSDTVSYTAEDPEGLAASGSVTVTVDAPVTLSIDTDDSVGDFSIEAMDGEIVLTVMEPESLAGVYTIETEELETGAVNLVPPSASGSPATGNTLIGSSGLWAGDEDHGAVGFEYQWYVGSDPVPGATTPSYTIRNGDLVSGLSLLVRAINSAGSQTATVEIVPVAWAPSNDASIVGWYDFSDSGTITLDGNNNISQITDKSGAGNTASQTTSALRPVATTIGSMGAADFSGGDVLEVSGNIQPGSSDSIILAVINDPDVAGRVVNFTSAGSTRFGIRMDEVTPHGVIRYTHDSSFDGEWYSAPSDLGPVIVGGYRTANKTYSGFAGNYSSSHNAGTCPTLDGWWIGSNAGSSALPTPIGEVVIAIGSGTDTALRQKIEGYLAHKWGLENDLPQDHPYKSTPPIG